MTNVGIVGVGTYLPKNIMTAKEISDATGGVWSEDAVRAKLGINQNCRFFDIIYRIFDRNCDI